MLNTAQKIGLARIAFRFFMLFRGAMGRPPLVEVTRGGVRWSLDLREGIDFSIYVLGGFEPANIKAYRKLVHPGDIVIDIGANIGAHTLPLASLVGDGGRVIACEPTAFAAKKLAANVRLNSELSGRIVLHQVMLVSDESRTLQPALYSSWPLAEPGLVHEKHKGRLMDTAGGHASTLDHIVRESGVSKVDFIKLDVDGHELDVLRGGDNTLAKFRPAIAMEMAPYIHAEEGHSFEELVKFLVDRNYIFRDLRDGRTLPSSAAEFRAMVPDGAGINVLAVLKGKDGH